MKNKLQKRNTPCHAELGSASHQVCHHNTSLRVAKRIEKSTPNLQISQLINSLILFLFLLSSFFSTAQQYKWDWGITGGGSTGEIGWDYQTEQIFDIAIDKNNNYYFLAKIKNGTPQLNGQPVTVYGNPQGGNDIFIFSTTSNGTVRWSQAIGGGGLFDEAYKIALDSNNNVYVAVNLSLANANKPVYFSPNEALPGPPANPTIISDFYKTTFLVKYDTNGHFVWKRALQGDVNNSNYDSGVLDILIDSNDNIHFIVGFKNGTHLNNTITVPNTVIIYQYYLVRYTAAGQLINSMLLPVADGTGFVPPSFTFKYDEPNNRYYIAGFRSYVNSNEDIPLTYGGSAVINNAYILAINATNGSELWRREMKPEGLIFHDNRIYDLDVDTNGDIYIAGMITKSSSENGVIKIINPKNPAVGAYTFNITSTQLNMPFITKLNKNGVVQWARTPNNDTSNSYYGYGLVINGNEVGLATNGTYMIWDNYSMNQQFVNGFQPDPVLIRLNKQTGTVIGMHNIQGSMNYNILTAVAVDNYGNYVVGGSFVDNIFTNNFNGVPEKNGNGAYHDFFVAKLTNPLSTDKFNKLNVNVYPNPTNDIINIETQETLQNYEVYNVLGQQIQRGSFNGTNQINLHGAASGSYFIKVTTTQGSNATVQVVKK